MHLSMGGRSAQKRPAWRSPAPLLFPCGLPRLLLRAGGAARSVCASTAARLRFRFFHSRSAGGSVLHLQAVIFAEVPSSPPGDRHLLVLGMTAASAECRWSVGCVLQMTLDVVARHQRSPPRLPPLAAQLPRPSLPLPLTLFSMLLRDSLA